MKQSVIAFVNRNLKKCAIALILISVLDVVVYFAALGHSSAVCVSSFLACAVAIYAITNVSGAKYGRTFNAHIFRWYYFRAHDKEHLYQTSCLKYVAVLLPISIVWSIVNVVLVIIVRS